MHRGVAITRDLLEVLLAYAKEHEPTPVQVPLGAVAGEEFGVAGPVLAEFYLPTEKASVSAVFGFDLGSPPGTVDARFLSHPGGELGVTQTDDLHATMVIAVPPWDTESVGVFNRHGERGGLEIVD